MLCVEITCRVQDLPAAAVFLLLYIRRIGQIPLLFGQFNQLGEFIVGIIDRCYFVRIKDNANKEMPFQENVTVTAAIVKNRTWWV